MPDHNPTPAGNTCRFTVDSIVERAPVQFRRLFTTMGASRTQWHLFATRDGVELARDGAHIVVLVPDVHTYTEERLAERIRTELRRRTPLLWV